MTRAIKDGPDPVDRYVGAQVRKRREELGLNQSELAGALSLTFQQVQKYEKAANRISASKLHRIAAVLKVPIEWFFPVEGEAAEAPAESPIEAQVMTRLRRFVSTFGDSDFVMTTAASGPMFTVAVLHKGPAAEELIAEGVIRIAPDVQAPAAAVLAEVRDAHKADRRARELS